MVSIKGTSICGYCKIFLYELCRYLLTSFHLPGESKKIDRMMQIFSEDYATCNPGGFFRNLRISLHFLF